MSLGAFDLITSSLIKILSDIGKKQRYFERNISYVKKIMHFCPETNE